MNDKQRDYAKKYREREKNGLVNIKVGSKRYYASLILKQRPDTKAYVLQKLPVQCLKLVYENNLNPKEEYDKLFNPSIADLVINSPGRCYSNNSSDEFNLYSIIEDLNDRFKDSTSSFNSLITSLSEDIKALRLEVSTLSSDNNTLKDTTKLLKSEISTLSS